MIQKSNNTSDNYLAVTINLMSGETVEGYLHGFSPIMSKLHFFEQNDAGKASPRTLNIGDIVYIGLHRPAGATKPPSSELQRTDKVKIITVNLERFDVYASPSASNTPGFYGTIIDTDLPYERIFFYPHGFRYQEKPEKIGDILVEQEVVAPEEIQKALEIQSQSMPPIGNILKKMGKVDDKDLAIAVETQQRQRMKMGDLLVDQELVSRDDVHSALADQPLLGDKPLGHILKNRGKIKDKHITTALEIQNRHKMRLGEILAEAGLITDEDLQHALDEQKESGHRLGEILLEEHTITEDELLSALSKKFRLPTVDLDEYDINPMAAGEISRDLIEKYKILPIDADEHSLTFALSDPMGMEAYDSISFKTGKKIHEVMTTASQLKRHIKKTLQEDVADEELSCEFLHQENEDEDETINELEITQSAEDAPIVSLVNRIIRNGLRKKASDIHILPQSNKLILAYRLNGQLLEESALDKSLHKQISARIKILSGMDISEQRMPQDGKMLLREGKQKYEFRVSCIPNSFGESMVLRILNKDMAVELDVLGLRDDDMKKLATIARKPFGLLLVTGPTGSGKSTTLFAVLKSIQHLPAHILTIEDPVESEIPGANQIQVNHKIGMTFARILRNVLRHDPDIIMIGEMRDPETAEIGIEAALTGHLMFSTLHTNSAVDTIIRLNDLGIPNYLIAPALLGIISQNLLKKLCLKCRTELESDDPAFAMVKDLGFEPPEKLYKATGCKHCHETGYDGRVMSYEFLAVNERIRQAIHDGIKGHQMQQIAAENGMQPKAESALKMAAEGIIDYNDFIYSVM